MHAAHIEAPWPALDYLSWQDSCATLHLWTQIAGKICLALTPLSNHWWNIAFHVTSRGLTTCAMPYGDRTFQIDFDFVDHRLHIKVSDGRQETMELGPRSVAAFYGEIMQRLHSLGIDVPISTRPTEIPNATPFERDMVHAAYDPEQVHRFWQALAHVDQVLTEFRAPFLGKASPVHFFWGGFDLAVTRFSGRRAPPPPSNPNIPDAVNAEGYSHECSSAGFWPGNGGFGRAAFYCYAYPQPPGFAEAAVTARGAYYDTSLGEFILPYDAVRQASQPRALLLEFLQQTYAAAADLGGWDRAALERPAS
jgi:hypothetical protein